MKPDAGSNVLEPEHLALHDHDAGLVAEDAGDVLSVRKFLVVRATIAGGPELGVVDAGPAHALRKPCRCASITKSPATVTYLAGGGLPAAETKFAGASTS